MYNAAFFLVFFFSSFFLPLLRFQYVCSFGCLTRFWQPDSLALAHWVPTDSWDCFCVATAPNGRRHLDAKCWAKCGPREFVASTWLGANKKLWHTIWNLASIDKLRVCFRMCEEFSAMLSDILRFNCLLKDLDKWKDLATIDWII